jgi:hypothetical protein
VSKPEGTGQRLLEIGRPKVNKVFVLWRSAVDRRHHLDHIDVDPPWGWRWASSPAHAMNPCWMATRQVIVPSGSVTVNLAGVPASNGDHWFTDCAST